MLQVILITLGYAIGDKEMIHSLPWEDYLILSLVCVFLVLFAGMMSGLTVGLLSLDELDLEMKLSTGSDKEKHMAKAVLKVINRHHLLLVTLLLANSAAMETLPLFLDEMFSEILAILFSVTFILLFGEVLP